MDYYNDVKSSDYCWIERTAQSNVEETVKMVEKHFGFENLKL